MTPEIFNVVRNYTDAENRAYFLGFCAGLGRENAPSEEEFIAAVETAKEGVGRLGPIYDHNAKFVAGTKVKAVEVLLPEILEAEGGITVGKVYEIVGRDEDDEPYFVDDSGDFNFAASYNGAVKFEIV